MDIKQLNILLADDDLDDCAFFKEALKEFHIPTHLTLVHDGEQLMQHLTDKQCVLPDVLFLDLNMPRKNGFECLVEIKLFKRLVHLPVIMYSTSFEQGVVDLLYKNQAQYFIRKPSEFSQFKKLIHQTLTRVEKDLSANQKVLMEGGDSPETRTRENFVLTVQQDSLNGLVAI